ncbi:hypothetical protein VTN02DRAFT_3076 [Thermoascus thermophilus]
MSLDEEVLEAVAKDGSMDYSRWPGMLEPLLERLDHIVYHEFPMPKIPPELAPSLSSQPSSFPSSHQSHEPSSSAPPSSSNKENAPPPSNLQTPPPTSAPSERIPQSQPESASPRPTEDALPPPLLLLLNSIKSTLKSYFSSKPPHTIQRLAELILRPTRHYRTLPAYLRAVDRVVAVSSTADIFPLPQSGVLGDSNLANGASNGGGAGFMADNTLGSDESLGGALLTPIPWLTNTGLEGSCTDLLEEGHESGGVTQGELIRKEQEAGVVAVSQQQTHAHTSVVTADGEAMETCASPPAEEEVPHARGPPVLGVEDMGLQDGKGVEMSLSNSGAAQGSVPGDQQPDLAAREEERKKGSNGDADGDGDIILGDVAGKEVGQEEAKKDTTGDTSTGPEGQA